MKRIVSAAGRTFTKPEFTRHVRASFPKVLRTPACYPDENKAIHLH